MSKVLTNQIEPKSGNNITTDKYIQQKGLPSVTVGGTNNGYVAVAANGILPFNDVLHGDSSVYSTSTYKFTAPCDGTYMATVAVLNDGDGNTHLDLYKNTSKVHRGGDGGNSTGRMKNAMFVVTLSSGDTLHWAASVADSYHMANGGSVHSYASYTLLG